MTAEMSRRDLLGGGAVLAAATAISAGMHEAQGAPHNPGKFRLGTVTYNLAKDWDIPTIIQRCKQAGFEVVELRTTHAHKVEPNLDANQRAAVRKQFAESGLILWGLGSVCEFHSPDPQVLRRNIDTCREFVKLAADVGARGVKVRPNGLPKEVEEAKTLEQIGKALHECAGFAADAGVQLYLEVHGGGSSHPPRIHTILQHADHKNLFVCWNCNDTDLKDGSVKEYFELLRPRMTTVHLHDLCDRKYPYRELFGLLKQTGFDGATLAEIPESTDPERVMSYYRAMWEMLQA
jgi:sugar phosphate isomerase/epimerase